MAVDTPERTATVRVSDGFAEGYFIEEGRLFSGKPPPGSSWVTRIGATYAKNGKENGQIWRVSCNGILQVKKVWKKASRARNAALIESGWEVIDPRPTSFKSSPLCDELWAHLTPLPPAMPPYRNCDQCGKLLGEFEGGELVVPKPGIEIQAPDIVRQVIEVFGGIVTETGVMKRYVICHGCKPDGWEWCRRCQTYHPLLEKQKAVAHLSKWLGELRQGATLPTGAHLISGITVLHPGDQIEGLVGAVTDALVCWPRKPEAIDRLTVNIERLEAIKEWHERWKKIHGK